MGKLHGEKGWWKLAGFSRGTLDDFSKQEKEIIRKGNSRKETNIVHFVQNEAKGLQLEMLHEKPKLQIPLTWPE